MSADHPEDTNAAEYAASVLRDYGIEDEDLPLTDLTTWLDLRIEVERAFIAGWQARDEEARWQLTDTALLS